MNRKEMESVIISGGSVLHEGKLHTSFASLPSKAELAKTEEEKQASAKEIDDQIAELLKRRAALDPKSAGKVEKDQDPKAAGKVEKDQENKNDDYPEKFPHRAKSVFEKLGKTYAEVSVMSREDLIAVNGIAEATADEIITFTSKN